MCPRWLSGLQGAAALRCPMPTGAALLCWCGRTELRCCSPASGRNCCAEGVCGTEHSLRGTRWEQGAATRQKHVEAEHRVVSQLSHISTSIQATFVLHVLSFGVAKSIRLCLLLLLMFPAFTYLLFLQLSLLLLSLPCTLRSIFLTPCNLSACLQPCCGFPPSLYPCTCSLPPAAGAGGSSPCTRGAGLLACCCVSGEMCSLHSELPASSHSELEKRLSVGSVP